MIELNGEQIKRALECCTDFNFGGCDNCFYDGTSTIICHSCVMRDALALINSYEQKIKQLTEENERLRTENENRCKDCAGCIQCKCDCSNIEADTVQKTQSEIEKRCIKGGIYPAFVASTIDQIAKEMLEGKE